MRRRIATQDLTMMALLAAIMCISSYISIYVPFSPVPITAQLLVVFLIALLLEPRQAALTILVWLLLGVAGLPVFSGGRGGIGVIAGPTGGFALAYLPAALLLSCLVRKLFRPVSQLLCLVGVGLPILYGIGLPWMQVVSGIGWKSAFFSSVLPFLPGDIIKAVAAVYLGLALRRCIRLRRT